jgi:Contractile injection system tube protein
VYNNNSKIHQPNYVQISWGSLLFQGQLSKYMQHYTLFSPEGIPLRVKIDLTFTQSISETISASWSKKGELLSEKVELKEGDSISSLCYKKYQDSMLTRKVALTNNLDSFRQIKPGSSIILP